MSDIHARTATNLTTGAQSCTGEGSYRLCSSVPSVVKPSVALATKSVQKILPVQRIPLRRTEARIAYDAPQFLFGCAVGHARGADHVLLQHHRAHVVAAEAQAHLADFQSLRDPTGLHVQEIRKIEPRNRQHLQVLDRRGLIPVAPAKRGVRRLKAPRDERREPARLLLQIVQRLEMIDAVFDGLASIISSL